MDSRRVDLLPLAAFIAKLQFVIGRVQRQSADVRHGRDARDGLLDGHEVLQLAVEGVELRVL